MDVDPNSEISRAFDVARSATGPQLKQAAIVEVESMIGELQELAVAFRPAPGEQTTIPVPVEMASRLVEVLLQCAEAIKALLVQTKEPR